MRDLRKIAELTPWRSTSTRHIRDIPDFPKPGIVFKDITPLLPRPGGAATTAVDAAGRLARDRARSTSSSAAEARGFILGARGRARARRRLRASRASRASCPHETVRAEYVLEYGVDALEMHADALADGRARARPRRPARHRRHGAGAVRAGRAGWAAVVAGCAFLIELAFLGGRERLAGYDVHALRRLRRRSDACGAPQPRRRRRRPDDGVGGRRRPAPPAALVAARDARRGRDAEALDRGAQHRARARPVRADFRASTPPSRRAARLEPGAGGLAVRAHPRARRRPRSSWRPTAAARA